MSTTMSPELHSALMTWRDAINERLALEYSLKYETLSPPTLELDFGRKYCRVWRVDVWNGQASRSAYAFVDMQTGDIFKPATWRAPAKHARGNIFQTSGLECCGPYGVAYIKGPSLPFTYSVVDDAPGAAER